MIAITQVAKDIYKIGPLETGHPSAATSPFLVIGSERAAIVEPGEDGQVPGLVEGIKKCVDPNRVAYVWASHIHAHHVQGVTPLLKELTKAKFLVHPVAARHVIEPARLNEMTVAVWGADCHGTIAPVPADRVMTVNDGQLLDLGGRDLEILHAPHHATHHMMLFDRLTRALFIGDTVSLPAPGRMRGGHDIRPPLFDVEVYVKTLRRIQALKPSMLLRFGEWGVNFTPDEALKWAEVDIRAIERICLEGMKQKLSMKEVAQRVETYESSVGMEVSRLGPGSRFTEGAMFGMVNYLKKKDPNLELPTGALYRMR